MKRNKGFTILELMIVIAILGILFAFVMPKVLSLKQKVETKTNAVIEQVQPNPNQLEKLE